MTRTPDEIKKGLDCCADGNLICAGNCVFDDDAKLGFPDCVKLLMTNALTYIQRLEAQVPRWISVDERLPETREWVLVIGEFVPEGGWFVPHIAEYYRDSWRLDDDEYSYPEDRHIKVTHWMPLPEPPKEDA